MWRIRDWDKIFENSQSKRYASISWVPIPNRHDTDGYTTLIEHDHGAMHYGAWIALVQMASRCKPRGTLARGDGQPHSIQSIARITRIGAHVFSEAIPRFLSEEIGWLENVDDYCLSEQSRSMLGACYPEQNGTELNREQKRIKPAGPVGPVGFLEDWDSENWTNARRMTTEAASKLWPNRNWKQLPMKPEDRCLLLKSAYVAIVQLTLDWWQSALDDTCNGSPRKPIGLFKTCLWKQPRADGLDLNKLLDSIKIPEKPKEPTSVPSDPQ